MRPPTAEVLANLVTPADAAERLGIPLGTFRHRSRRPDHPNELARIGGRPIYWWPDLETHHQQEQHR